MMPPQPKKSFREKIASATTQIEETQRWNLLRLTLAIALSLRIVGIVLRLNQKQY